MPPVGFDPTIPAGERPQAYAWDRTATGTGTLFGSSQFYFKLVQNLNSTDLVVTLLFWVGYFLEDYPSTFDRLVKCTWRLVWTDAYKHKQRKLFWSERWPSEDPQRETSCTAKDSRLTFWRPSTSDQTSKFFWTNYSSVSDTKYVRSSWRSVLNLLFSGVLCRQVFIDMYGSTFRRSMLPPFSG